MLIQFTVENYRSFRERTVFSMRKASNVERGEDAPDVVKGTDILRCAAMYGANASGKSNFVKALRFARELVVTGGIHLHPFRLDPDASKVPSHFEFYLRALSGAVYGYGYALRPDAVVQEWLTKVVDGGEVEIFSREGNTFQFAAQSDSSTDELLRLVSSATRNDQLLLQAVRIFKRERFPRAFADVLLWFEYELVIIEPNARFGSLIADADRSEAFRVFLGEVLRRADTGISGVRTVRRSVSKAERSALEDSGGHPGRDDDVVDGDRRVHYRSEGDELYAVELRFDHASGEVSNADEFELADESDGTVRLLDLSPMLFHAQRPLVCVVDELDRSVHTALSRWLVERFITESAGSASQLIFTTHDTNLLDVPQLQPDSIWFAAKDKTGASTLYSLAEFKAEQIAELRKDLEKAYLVGRFGGVPRIRGAERP